MSSRQLPPTPPPPCPSNAYLTVRAYPPVEHVVSQLDLVHIVVLGLNNWHLTMPTLQLRLREGGLGQVGLSTYAQWVHSQTFVTAVLTPRRFSSVHHHRFQRRASRNGILLEEEFLPYVQLGPVPRAQPTFLKGLRKSYLVVRQKGGGIPPPLRHRLGMLGVWNSVLFRNDLLLTYHCPALRGVYRWCDRVGGGGGARSWRCWQHSWPPCGDQCMKCEQGR